MKLNDLRPAEGARTEKTRVGRGIAAGKGKTAGRGTKGQKARAGGSIPPWFEGGQTPLHMRVPKLRGFKNRFKIDYQVVNVGRISDYAAAGRFTEAEEARIASGAAAGRDGSEDHPLTVNAEMLRTVGLISSVRQPVKILGQGEVGRKLFVLADAFTNGAREKIEAAGGVAQVLEAGSGLDAIGVGSRAPAGRGEREVADDGSVDETRRDVAGPARTPLAVTTGPAVGGPEPIDASPSPLDPRPAGEGKSRRRSPNTRESRADHG